MPNRSCFRIAKLHFFDDRNGEAPHFFEDSFSRKTHIFEDKNSEMLHFFEDMEGCNVQGMAMMACRCVQLGKRAKKALGLLASAVFFNGAHIVIYGCWLVVGCKLLACRVLKNYNVAENEYAEIIGLILQCKLRISLGLTDDTL